MGKLTLEELRQKASEGTLIGKFDVDNEIYHSLGSPAVSKSDLDLIHRAPFIYYEQRITGEYKPDTSDCMVNGGALHCALIEPELFKKKYVSDKDFLLVDGVLKTRNTKIYKEGIEKYQQENPDKIIVKYKDYEKIEETIASVMKSDLAQILLTNGEAEMSYYWENELTYSVLNKETGEEEKFKRKILNKCRPDYVRISKDGKSYISEIKTIDDARGFTPKKIYDFRYHVQAAHCLEGIQKVTGCDPNQLFFAFIVVERSYPFGVRYIMLEYAALIQGLKERDRDMELLLKCLHTNTFPKYETVENNFGKPCFEILDIPNWVHAKEEFAHNE